MATSLYLNGTYTKQEMADILHTNLNDTHNTGQNLRKLAKWGYGYTRDIDGNFIIEPIELTNMEGRLRYLLERYMEIAPQANMLGFAAFIYELNGDSDFQSMPWKQRAEILNDKYGIAVSDRTLRNWTTRLTMKGILRENAGLITIWQTTDDYQFDDIDLEENIELQQYVDFYDYQRNNENTWIEPDAEQQDKFRVINQDTGELYTVSRRARRTRVDMTQPAIKKRRVLYEKRKQELQEKGDPGIWATLWREFHTRYFTCKTFELDINNELMNTVVTEVCEIVDGWMKQFDEEMEF